jgi:hypothetical protein
VPATPARTCGHRHAAALAGTYAELEQAAKVGATVERALYVLIDAPGPYLTDLQRDELWELFGVPVFAMLCETGGHLLGWECEAHAGFHRPEKMENRPAVPGTLVRAPCECGRPGIRILVPQPAVAQPILPFVAR